jgi:chromosome segregation ATPase
MLLEKVELSGFRNFETLTLNCEDGFNSILADNGWGKSNVIDAMMWCLTGKLADGSSDIASIKNKITPRKEVKVSLKFDGLKLSKVYYEKWTKIRGTVREELTGHEQQYFINDVECNATYYGNQISAILGYSTEYIPIVMLPTYFGLSLDWKVRRTIINSMVGDITPSDVISRDEHLQKIKELVNKEPKIDLLQKALKKSLSETKMKEATLESKVLDYKQVVVGYDSESGAKLEQEYKNIENRLIELKGKLYVADSQNKQKELKEQDLEKLRHELLEVKALTFNQPEPIKITCKNCGHLIDEVSYGQALSQYNKSKDDFIKSKNQRIASIISKGTQLAEAIKQDLTIDKEALQKEVNELETKKDKLFLQVQSTSNQKVAVVNLNQALDDLAKTRREIANIEHYIELMQLYVEIYLAILNERVDSIFNGVKFKLIEQNIKEGSWTETCEIMDGLVPYNRTNTAQQIKLGIKVIEAIKHNKAIQSLPILVDNAEAVVNRQFETTSQVIAFIAGKGE